ncbi:MAG: PhzF family phenazine biosynthesis protein [Thermoleophilia bacterium]|nr:PhzF family phenazine biosynthesis protein [Thermoleophilia bacterium]MDH4339559.1 PhzF family phenazine biosynthesis protein [Thermoleophilia bacterium]MDH5280634.1 PhzF family phenazine biosynthesis protein [Thermoleophilia bacterium]
MPALRYVIVDVFTDRALAGNPLAVFTDARGTGTKTMQALAKEIGFSETTFVLPPEQGGHARIRIFNPRAEMPFAGHPTLGTAFVLAAPLQLGMIGIETGAGLVEITLERDSSGHVEFGRMQQPVPKVYPFERTEDLFAALGIAASELPVELYDNGATHIVVTLASEQAVAALAPEPSVIARFEVTGVNCLARAGDRWKTRMFWPLGEDAATGSAAGPIACHLCRHGLVPWGTEIEILQGEEIGRPSTLYARADGSEAGIERVEVSGCAVVVARGEFRLEERAS